MKEVAMKVLVADDLSPQGLEILRQAEGIEVEVKTGLRPEELKEIIGCTKPSSSARAPR